MKESNSTQFRRFSEVFRSHENQTFRGLVWQRGGVEWRDIRAILCRRRPTWFSNPALTKQLSLEHPEPPLPAPDEPPSPSQWGNSHSLGQMAALAVISPLGGASSRMQDSTPDCNLFSACLPPDPAPPPRPRVTLSPLPPASSGLSTPRRADVVGSSSGEPLKLVLLKLSLLCDIFPT